MNEMTDELYGRIAARLKAMGNAMRLRILHTLHDGELSVSEILAQVGGSQANVSKHLNVLRNSDLVACRRDGVSVYYRISDPTVFAICDAVCDSLLHHASTEVTALAEARARLLAAG